MYNRIYRVLKLLSFMRTNLFVRILNCHSGKSQDPANGRWILDQVQNDRLRLIWIFWFLVLLISSGCSEKEIPIVDQAYINSLADTVFAGELSRQVLLTDGTGGYYFDDALRTVKRGAYGLFRNGSCQLVDWELHNQIERIDTDIQFCIVHPEWVERHYTSGLIVRVEAPFNIPGLLISITNPKRNEITFRPWYPEGATEISAVNKNDYITEEINSPQPIAAYIFPPPTQSLQEGIVREQDYPLGHLTGEKPSAMIRSFDLVPIKGKGQYQFAFSINAENAEKIYQTQEQWREKRQNWSTWQLERLMLRCDNKQVEHAFAWSRLTLAKLIVTDSAKTELITAIPNQSVPNEWDTYLSLPGLALSQQDHTTAFELLNDNFNINTDLAGLKILTLRKLEAITGVVDTLIEDKLAHNLSDSLKQITDRLEMGMVINIDGYDYMGNQMMEPYSRHDATIESQLLFSIVRGFLKQTRYADKFPAGLFSGANDAIFRPGASNYPPTTSGHSGVYRLPLNLSSIMYKFNVRNGQSYDRFIVDKSNEKQPQVIIDDTQGVSHILALGWMNPQDAKLNRKLLDNAYDVGLVGDAGFRSLASTDLNYHSAHEFLNEDNPRGTVSRGDLLVWTAGRLADMLASIGQMDSVYTLVERLSERTVERGVIGGLPEAENGEPLPIGGNIVRNPIHCTATAEFIRIMMENIIRFNWDGNEQMSIRPNFPRSWGAVSIEASDGDNRITITRISQTKWTIRQSGIHPYLGTTIILHPVFNERVLSTINLKPDETVELHLYKLEDRWKVKDIMRKL